MIRIRTPSRLHFGLFNLSEEEATWPSSTGEQLLPARCFGGAGLMVEQPGLQLAVIAGKGPEGSVTAEGPLAERALAFARRVRQNMEEEGRSQGKECLSFQPLHLVVEQAPPEHVGLGTGTQLGLAVARALTLAWNLQADLPALARWSGRGLRSSLGAHGFAQGGFLVEAGKAVAGASPSLAPLVARVTFPEDWRVLLARPARLGRWHGSREIQAFAELTRHPPLLSRIEALCRLVLLGMLPALGEGDLDAFGEALFDFNRRSGEAFAPVQGGLYASEAVTQLVNFLRQQGAPAGRVRGVGQSSWGPTVFALLPDQQQAEFLVARLQTHFGLQPGEVFVTPACNRGASEA